MVFLELKRRQSPDAEQLWDDVLVLRSTPVRRLHMFYERDGFDSSSLSGQRLLRGLLDTLPDNKLVEDVHNNIRRCAKSNPNPVLKMCHIQDLTISSDVLRERGISHPAELTKNVWCKDVKRTSPRYKRRSHHAFKHKLEKKWTAVMGQKRWHTLSEETIRKTAAAWHWLHVGMEAANTAVSAGLFSKLLLLGIVVRERDVNRFFHIIGPCFMGSSGLALTAHAR